MKHLAHDLRKRQTEAERLLWRHLRDRQIAGCKFRRQFSIGTYIVDFICLDRRLIIEVDGGQHLESAADEARTRFLEGEEFRVIRFWNNEVLANVEAVRERIFGIVGADDSDGHPPITPSPCPSPPRGEGTQK